METKNKQSKSNNTHTNHIIQDNKNEKHEMQNVNTNTKIQKLNTKTLNMHISYTKSKLLVASVVTVD